MRVLLIVVPAFFAMSGVVFAAENCTAGKKHAVCTDASVMEKVDWACKLVESKGKEAIKEIRKMRYDCCGEPDYVWLNDMHPKMIMHPIKPAKDGADLTKDQDPDGKFLFVEFVKAVKAKPAGDWVEYQWPKFGEKQPTPKKSWVKACKVAGTADSWVVGSGTWK